MDTLIYIIRIAKTGIRNFLRNGWLSVAASTVMVITLFTISLFAVLNLGINAAIATIQDKIDISVYLNDEVGPAEMKRLQGEIEALPSVREVRHVSKSEALAIYRGKNKDNQDLLSSISEEDNPLPASLEIKAISPSPENFRPVQSLLEKEENKPLVHDFTYQGEKEATINKLVRITNFIKTAGIGLSAVFVATSLLVIFNTVRIAIFTRREEIEIMKLVGATSNFIRWPFIIEGATYGAIATLISFLLQYLAISFGGPLVAGYLGEGVASVFRYYTDNLALVIGIQLLIGIFIGVASSFIAIRRYLRIETVA